MGWLKEAEKIEYLAEEKQVITRCEKVRGVMLAPGLFCPLPPGTGEVKSDKSNQSGQDSLSSCDLEIIADGQVVS